MFARCEISQKRFEVTATLREARRAGGPRARRYYPLEDLNAPVEGTFISDSLNNDLLAQLPEPVKGYVGTEGGRHWAGRYIVLRGVAMLY